MSGLRRVLLGGVIAAAATGVAGVVSFAPIAEDVASRTAERLKLDGKPWATVTIDGRDVTLDGVAPEPEDRRLAVEAADRVFGVRIVEDHTSVLPLASPYAWGVEKKADRVELVGAVPGEAARADLLKRAATALPGATIDDSTTPARGAPEDWRLRGDVALALAADLETGTVAWTGEVLSVTGTPRDFAAWQRLRRALAEELPAGTRTGDVALVTPPPPRWFFTATRAGDRLVFDGFLPDDATRERLHAAAAAVGPLEDRTLVAPGAAGGTPAALDFALRALADLVDGAVGIDPHGFSIAGRPKSWNVYRDLEATLKAGVPGGLPLAADRLEAVVPSPYELRLVAGDGTVEASGFVPDAASRDRIGALLAANFTSARNRLEVAPGAPAGYVDAIVAAIPTLARFGRLDFHLSGTGASLTGAAPTEALGRQIASRLATLLPSGVSLAPPTVTALPPPPQVAPAECQADLARVQSGEKILFDTGRATLREEGVRILDALVGAALKCVSAHITVEGHTDAEGDVASNQALSEARARAVVDHLVAAGLAADRLTAIGYGATRPIGDDATEEGRRNNRRIEFRVE